MSCRCEVSIRYSMCSLLAVHSYDKIRISMSREMKNSTKKTTLGCRLKAFFFFYSLPERLCNLHITHWLLYIRIYDKAEAECNIDC